MEQKGKVISSETSYNKQKLDALSLREKNWTLNE